MFFAGIIIPCILSIVFIFFFTFDMYLYSLLILFVVLVSNSIFWAIVIKTSEYFLQKDKSTNQRIFKKWK